MAGRRIFKVISIVLIYDLRDYDTLFDDETSAACRNQRKKKLPGKENIAAINDLGIYPRPFREKLPIWVAIGNSASVQRAARLGLPYTIAIIGGKPEQFGPYTDFYRDEYAKAGHDISNWKYA